MNECFLDIHWEQLIKKGEEVSGDYIKYRRTEDTTIIVLSNGLGSGIKANILATLTTDIIIKMMIDVEIELEQVIQTVVSTLPRYGGSTISSSTFTIIQVDNKTQRFSIVNCDNPPVFYFRQGQPVALERKTRRILAKNITTSSGILERGDFLGAMTDGMMFCGMNKESLNFGWGWQGVADYLTKIVKNYNRVEPIVNDVIQQSEKLSQGVIEDDATFAGLYVRPKQSILIFTGPPLEPDRDREYVDQLLNFPGKKIVCGGTTGQIVANYLKKNIQVDLSTVRPNVPPIGFVEGIDLVTEGIYTIALAIEYLVKSQGSLKDLPNDYNGAYLLSKEIIESDYVFLLVGQKVNEAHQNPLLPRHISVRRSLIENLLKVLQDFQKEFNIHYC